LYQRQGTTFASTHITPNVFLKETFLKQRLDKMLYFKLLGTTFVTTSRTTCPYFNGLLFGMEKKSLGLSVYGSKGHAPLQLQHLEQLVNMSMD
jgi:hypothetical protein